MPGFRENVTPVTLGFTVLGGAVMWASLSLPGLLCIALAIPIGGFWAWTLCWAGGLWTLFMFGPYLELAGPAVATTPSQVIGDFVLFLATAWPGITLLVYHGRMGWTDPWIPSGVGVLLLAWAVRSWLRSLQRQRRLRALTGGPEPDPAAQP